jgi:hypothetical protein
MHGPMVPLDLSARPANATSLTPKAKSPFWTLPPLHSGPQRAFSLTCIGSMSMQYDTSVAREGATGRGVGGEIRRPTSDGRNESWKTNIQVDSDVVR